jgi:hypothetical protein
VLLRHDLGARQAPERELGEREASREVEHDVPVPGVDDDEHEQPLQPEVLEGRLRERHMPVVWRIEGAAEESGHSNSTGSSGLTPAARSSSSVA